MTDPAVVHDLDETTYHSHPALSCSGAKKLLPPSCPAIFKWERDNPQPRKKHFEFGKAAHAAVLGTGPNVVTVDAADWRTKAAQESRAAIEAAGGVAVLPQEAAQITAMAAAIRAHPVAARLFNPERGRAEVSLFATDPDTGVPLRGRVDWLPYPSTGRLIIPDYKTTTTASPAKLGAKVADCDWHMQAPWYTDLARLLEIAEDVAFVFAAQEKDPPYLVTVFELDSLAVRVGRERNRRAIEIFHDCTESDLWPGYSTDVEPVGLPQWAVYQYESETAA